MATVDETPAQRQARIRREKREAKIKDNGQDRLDKITKLSGRTPESMRNESPAPTPPYTASLARTPQPPATPTPGAETDPAQLRAQEEYLRALLRAPAPSSNEQASQPGSGIDTDDPMAKMLQTMISSMNGDPNASEMPTLNPDDIAKATGLPSFLTNIMLGKQEAPPTPAQQQEARIWTVVHILFALLAGLYTLFTINKLTQSFGDSPPAPATIQNPASLFFMGEALLHGSRRVLSNTPVKQGFGFWIQTAKELARDALIMVFLLGIYSWCQGLT